MAALPYLVYSPATSSQRDQWPLVLFLHGSGERGGNIAGIERYGLPRYMSLGLPVPGFVVAPHCPSDATWSDLIDSLEATLDELLYRLPVSPRRVSLTGFSLGGFGLWTWALESPSRFAALAAVAGCDSTSVERVRTDGGRLRDIPICLIHGADDRHVPFRAAEQQLSALKACGCDVRLTQYPNADHGETCHRAYSDDQLTTWLISHQRQAA